MPKPPQNPQPNVSEAPPQVVEVENPAIVANEVEETIQEPVQQQDAVADAMDQSGLSQTDMPLILTPVKSSAEPEQHIDQDEPMDTAGLDTSSSAGFETPTKNPAEDFEAGAGQFGSLQQKGASRKSKQKKEAEVAQQLLEPEGEADEALRKQHEALEISIHAQEVLTPDQMDLFCKLVLDESLPNKDKFIELHSLCSGHLELQELLLDLLTASEALQVGFQVYQQFCLRDASKKFLRKVKILYANQPTILTKLLKEISTLLSNPEVHPDELLNLGQKYFKTNQRILDEFTTFISGKADKNVNDLIHGIDYLLFLGVPYPENLLPDPEMINLSDEEDEEKGNFDEKVNLFGEYLRSRFKE